MKYRLYSFVNNLYMSPLQWGIQTAHCVSTMSLYKHNTPEYAVYHDWALNDPTIIVCQGGNVAALTQLYSQLALYAGEIKLPVVKFHEDEQSLGGVITAVAVILPETLFECFKSCDAEEFLHPTGTVYSMVDNPHEYALLSIVKSARLA